MRRPKDSERTRLEILSAARELFAAKGIRSVTVREIAAAAGVAHSLVNRYFGSKSEMVAEILLLEASAFKSLPDLDSVTDSEGLQVLRSAFAYALAEERTTQVLLTRAELVGLEPEKMISLDERPLHAMSEWIARKQRDTGQAEGSQHDPAVVTAVVGAAIFGFSCMAPFLMTALGLEPEDYPQRQDEIVDVLVDLVALGTGLDAD